MVRHEQMNITIFEQSILPLYESSRSDWLEQARSVAWTIGKNGGTVTINDVRRVCPPPVEVDPRVMGAVFLRKLWRKVGYSNSSRSESHGRPVALFELK